MIPKRPEHVVINTCESRAIVARARAIAPRNLVVYRHAVRGCYVLAEVRGSSLVEFMVLSSYPSVTTDELETLTRMFRPTHATVHTGSEAAREEAYRTARRREESAYWEREKWRRAGHDAPGVEGELPVYHPPKMRGAG